MKKILVVHPKESGCQNAPTMKGLERMLADAGLRYFLTDGHGILYARPRPRLALMHLFLPKQEWRLLVAITNLPSRFGLLK